MNFVEKLTAISRKNQSLVCVGLDPDLDLMPPGISVLDFNKEIILATADFACAYKLNFAFYEALGEVGLHALKKSVEFIPSGIVTIGDAKRGDIGNTARAYAKSIFEYYGFDAATVSPYLGIDSIDPFLKYSDKGVFILCRTSNPSAKDFQSLICKTLSGELPLYAAVAQKAGEWNRNGNIGLVVGATYPEELKVIRRGYPDMPLLVPGIGAQGGDLELTLRNGLDTHGEKAIINSSRQILYAAGDRNFAGAARLAAKELRNNINRIITDMKK